MLYLSAVLLNIMMLFLLPNQAVLGQRLVISSICVLYFCLYFLFTHSQWVANLQGKKLSLLRLFIAAIALSSFFCFLVKGHLSFTDFEMIFLVYAIPFGLLLPTRQTFAKFHPLDFLVFLAIFIPLEINVVTLPLIALPNVLSFDGIFMVSVLFTLFVYVVFRQIDIGLHLVKDKQKWLETIGLSILLIFIEIVVGTHFHVIKFVGWQLNIPNTFSLIVFMLFNAAFLEEIFFRGLIYNYLVQYLAKFHTYLPLALNTFLFGLTHLDNGGMPMFYLSSIAGLFYCVVYMRTRSIFCATLIHALTNICWKLFFV